MMMEKRATSYDVAKLAGVSQSAVSRVFSPNGSASKKTREKVLEAARELAFVPNPIAKSLSLGRSRLAGLIVTQYAQQNYPVALRSAVDVMSETGDSLLIQIIDSSDYADTAIEQLLQKRVDIVICAASITVAAAQSCKDAAVPLVLINRTLDFEWVDQVVSPNADIMHDVAEHLATTGARETLFIDGGDDNWISVERRRGYVDGCRIHGLPDPAILSSSFDYDGGLAAIADLGESVRKFDAVVAANDPMALGALDALRHDIGLDVPSDIQVVGHDDTEVARYQSYGLTSVRQDMHNMLLKAIELAYARLDEPGRDKIATEVENELLLRSTTKNRSD
ncbi:MAG: LacI family DNA-binding transcriptional regulator [Stappiaceae bacterium]